MTRKRDIERPYPPALVSAETLAYLLDSSRSTIDDYVERGLLPRSVMIGALRRWWWRDVEASIIAQNRLASAPSSGTPSDEDPFLRGVKLVASSNG